MTHGCTLEKFIGEAVMAIFGLPRAYGDDAEQALAATLALRQVVENVPLLPPAFRLRIGVNSGEVINHRRHQSGRLFSDGRRCQHCRPPAAERRTR